jgi:putative ABC transport system ATP-binding protein
MQAAPPSILCRGVTKSYDLGARSVEALRGVDLTIEGAGFYAIMGASGSGKSTLMHLIAGLDRPTSGSVEVAGMRIDSLGEKELTLYRRRRIGIVFQHFNLLPSMTALDNVVLPAMLDGMPRRDAEKRARELLDDLGVGARADHRPDALSGGEQQRVAIARAFVGRPAVLFADEPTGNLDTTTGESITQLLFDLNAEAQTTLVLVTHDRTLAARCGRTLSMAAGRLV